MRQPSFATWSALRVAVPRSAAHIGDVLLDVSRTDSSRGIPRRLVLGSVGEIVGLSGLVGAGRTEVARVLFGLDRADGGEIRLDGKRVSFQSPSEALVRAWPTFRKTGTSTASSRLHDLRERDPADHSAALSAVVHADQPRATLAAGYAERLRIRATGMNDLIESLSGGNQQKVVIAKWLATKPRVLILDEPTRGVDIGAKVEVHRIISDLAASGLGIILISSELPEVLAMSDRILVLHEGHMTAEIPRADCDEERVMLAATGQNAEETASGS